MNDIYTEEQITQELLKQHLEYRNGHLWWIKPTAWRVKIGQQFGTCQNSGYRAGMLKGKLHYEHRLIWLYIHGIWPKEHIDHINGIKDDNRIENLRECTVQQNQFNKKSKKDSSSKYKGVHWCKRDKRWVAQYRYKSKQYRVGYYECEVEAAEDYRKATEHLHRDYANYDQ